MEAVAVMKRLWVTALTVFALLTGVTACSGPDEASAGDVAMFYLDAFRGDPSVLREYNPDSSFSDEYFESLAPAFAQLWGVTFSDEQNGRIADAYRSALRLVEAALIDEAQDGETAVATLEIRGVDLPGSLTAQIQAIDQTAITAENITDTYTRLLVATLTEIGLAPEAAEVEVSLTRKGSLWVPEDSAVGAIIGALLPQSPV